MVFSLYLVAGRVEDGGDGECRTGHEESHITLHLPQHRYRLYTRDTRQGVLVNRQDLIP